MDNNLNNVEFINKKNNMQRSSVAIATLLGIILFLLLVIGYLIYTNLKKPDEVIVDKCPNETPIVENKKEEEPKEETSIIVNEETLDTLIKLLPTIKETNYLDYNIFVKKEQTKEELSSLKTSFDPNTFQEVYYIPYQIEITSKNTYLDIYVAIHDKIADTYFQSLDSKDNPIKNSLFNPSDKGQLKEYGGRYKITYLNGAFGYILEKVEFVKEKRK